MTARLRRWNAWRQHTAPVGLLAAIFWFYLWTVSQGLPLPFGTSQGAYPLLTDGFLAGQLSLPIAPHPALLKARDTYNDPHHRPPYFHDASLYKGKYYLYFGVTPVILLFLPFRVLGVGNLPESAAVAVFMFGSVLVSLLTLSFLRRTEFPTLRQLPYEIYLMLALGGAIPYFLRRPAMYEVAIACGSFCVMAAIYFLVTLESRGRISLWRAALASLFLGLAVGARPHLLVASPLLVFGPWLILRRQKRWPSPEETGALLVPIVLVGFGLAWYNYARFDDWTEFGRWYQLAGEPVRQLHFDIRRIPFLSYLYVLHPGRVDLAFPYVHVKPASPPELGGITVEPVAGLLYSTPILYVLALLPLFGSIRRSDPRTAQPIARSAHIWAWVFVTLAVAQLLFLATFPGATMRYLIDFSPLLMMAAAIVMMGVALRLERSRWRLRVKSALVVLVGVTIFLNVGLGITGYYDNLQEANPAAYNRLKRPSDRVVDAIAPWLYPKTLRLLSISAPGGMEAALGAPAFWVGDSGAEFELYARDDGFVTFRTIVSLHRNVKALTDVRLTIASEGGESTILVTPDRRTEFALPVRRGHNRIVLSLGAPPADPERSRPRVVLFACKAWRFSKTAPGL
jgi:hypothetical protein